jgi:hypothetical protein
MFLSVDAGIVHVDSIIDVANRAKSMNYNAITNIIKLMEIVFDLQEFENLISRQPLVANCQFGRLQRRVAFNTTLYDTDIFVRPLFLVGCSDGCFVADAKINVRTNNNRRREMQRPMTIVAEGVCV